MAQPITWRNVDAPDLRGAASMLQLASNGINSGFDKLNQVLQNEQATADANWKVQRDNNTQAFLNSINQYRTPEEYQAAVTSGALDPGKFGTQIDQAAVRSALDGRLAILQDRATKAGQFEDQQKAREAQPIVDRLNMMALSEDKTVRQSAKDALGIYAANGMIPKASEIAGNIRNTDHQNVQWAQDAVEFDRKGEKHSSDLLTAAAQRRHLDASSNQANAAAESYRAANSDEKVALKAALAASKSQNEAAALLIKNSPLDAGTMDTYAGQKAFEAELEKLGLNSAQANSIRQEYTKQFSDGILITDKNGQKVRVPLPVSTALAGVKGTEDDWIRANWAGNSYRGVNAAKKVLELAADPTYFDSVGAAMQAQGIQYRPLTKTAEPDVSASVSVSRRTSLPKPSGFGVEDGADLVSQTVKARADRIAQVQGMMTQAEIAESQKTGKLPFRIKKLLEAGNER